MSKLLLVILALLVTTQAAAVDAPPAQNSELRPEQRQQQAAHLAADLLMRYHYKPLPLDELMSEQIFAHYLKALDPDKIFFAQTDVEQWRDMRKRLGEAILKEDLSIPFAVFNSYRQRALESAVYARSLLSGGFDFEQQESYQYAREKESWPGSAVELHELWRKRVKNDWLRLKLTGKDAKSIVDTLDKRYENSLRRIARIKSEDAFQFFMNAYTMSIDPHTNYMAPRAAEEFQISMKLSLGGIGALLTERDDCVVIRELTTGGPAANSGQLKTGDRIVGVAQGNAGPWTEIQGWRLDDSIDLIRGDAGTLVRLDIIPAESNRDGKHRQISLVRKKISLDEQAARQSVVTVSDRGLQHRIGVITLPSFYQDVEARQKGNPAFKSATRDVARLVRELKKLQIDGILIDLRNNGGGSLNEAVELTGLFIGAGPVVQERDAQGNIRIESSNGTHVVWAGPLGVLINRESASASEIFAAAIQDYGRGILIGEKSFGKGTVQTMVDLDQVAGSDRPQYGELKLTIAQFFRVDGGTTQLRGVTPDIALPSRFDPDEFGESSFDNALPWMQIQATDYIPSGYLKQLEPSLGALHNSRMSDDQDLQRFQEDIAELKAQRKRNAISLNEKERRAEMAGEEAKQVARNQPSLESWPAAKDDGLQGDERDLATELRAEKLRKKAKDVILNEAAHIVSDESVLLATSTNLAVRTKPGLRSSAGRQRDGDRRDGSSLWLRPIP